MIPTADPSTSLGLNVETLPSHIVQPLIQIPTDFSSPPPWLRLSNAPFQTPIYQAMVPMDVMSTFAIDHDSKQTKPNSDRLF